MFFSNIKHVLCMFITCMRIAQCSKIEGSSDRQSVNLAQNGDKPNVRDYELMTQILLRLEYLESREQKYERNMEEMQSTIELQNKWITTLEGELNNIRAAKVQYNQKDMSYKINNGNITGGFETVENHMDNDHIGKSRERRQQVKACAFYASIYNHHLQQLGANQDIPFDKVYTNVGNAYHPNLGVFIAPQPGTYVFSTTIMDVNSHDSRYYFSVNGQAQGNLFLHGVNSYLSSSSRTAIFLLNAGDEVAVKNAHINEGVYGYEYSSFSGFLVSFDDSAGVIVG